MTTITEYALLSAAANAPMQDIPQGLGENEKNALPVTSPNGDWEVIPIQLSDIYQQLVLASGNNLSSGIQPDNFSLGGMAAAAYRNINSNEIVISYRGTQVPINELSPSENIEFAADNQANAMLGLGNVPDQVYAAYFFWRAVVATGVDPTNITFTGHSLGGGLASIMAMYTGQEATVFDPAPSLDTAIKILGTGAAGVTGMFDSYIWPPIIGRGMSESEVLYSRQTLVDRYVSYGDPIDLSFRLSLQQTDNMSGIDTYYHLNFDHSYFAESWNETTTPGGTSKELHSINLVALQSLLDATASGITNELDGTISQNTALGTVSDHLLDLMTQVRCDY